MWKVILIQLIRAFILTDLQEVQDILLFCTNIVSPKAEL